MYGPKADLTKHSISGSGRIESLICCFPQRLAMFFIRGAGITRKLAHKNRQHKSLLTKHGISGSGRISHQLFSAAVAMCFIGGVDITRRWPIRTDSTNLSQSACPILAGSAMLIKDKRKKQLNVHSERTDWTRGRDYLHVLWPCQPALEPHSSQVLCPWAVTAIWQSLRWEDWLVFPFTAATEAAGSRRGSIIVAWCPRGHSLG